MVNSARSSVGLLKLGLVAGWLVLAGAGVLLTGVQGRGQILFGLSLIFPVLLASFFYSRSGGLAAALAASLVCGSLLIRNPAGLQSPPAMEILALIVVFHAVALVASWLADREREARLRYQGLFEGVPVGIYRSARNGRILEANQVMAHMLGYPDRESLLTLNMADLYATPAERERVISRFTKDVRVLDYETRYRSRDGEVIWVRNRCRAWRGADGGITHFEGSLEDITERKRAEGEICAVRSRLENIIEFLPDATLVVDAGRRIIAWNKAMEHMTGAPKNQVLGRGDYEYARQFYGERRPALLDFLWGEGGDACTLYDRLERVGTTLIAETRAPLLNAGRGAHVWITAAPLYDADGRLTGAIECVRDITARREAEIALADSEENYRSIVENASEGIFQATPDGQIISANPAMARILGFPSPGHIVDGLVDFRRLAADPLDTEADFFRGMWRLGDVRRSQLRLRCQDGRTIWAAVSARATLDRKGAPYIEGFLQDVTAARDAQELLTCARDELERHVGERTRELEKANIRLRELDQVKSAFLSLASHELRTPLTSVLGFAKLIRKTFASFFLPLATDDAQLAPRARRILDNLDIIQGEGDRLTRLINDLLDLNKIESGTIEWRDQPLDMPRILRRAMEALRGQVEYNPDVRLQEEVPKSLPSVVADRDRVIQVLSNLLHNAAKFTAAGFIRLEALAVNGWVEVRIRDSGPGISPRDHENIFRKFFQVRDGDTLRDKPRGTGLGLTICRQVVEHYGGRIWVESEIGQGSTFIFRLPAHKAD